MGMKTLARELNKDKPVLTKGREVPDIPRIPTGSLSLDAELMGGLPKGRVIGIVGLESAGKSAMVMKVVAEHMKTYPEEDVLWLDAEGVFDPIWASILGIDVDSSKFWISRPEYTEQAFNLALRAIEEGAGLVVIDSLAALTPKAEAEADMEAVTVGLAARLNRKMLRKFQSAANDPNGILPTLIYINHLSEDVGARVPPGMPIPNKEPGGRALRFFPSVKIELKAGDMYPKALATDEEIQPKGRVFKFYVTKNKTSPPFRRGHVWFYFDTLDERRVKGSYDRTDEAIRYGIKYGIILRPNSKTYHLPNPDSGELISITGSGKVADYIRSHEDYRVWFESEVIRRVKEGLMTDGAPVSEDEGEEENKQGEGE